MKLTKRKLNKLKYNKNKNKRLTIKHINARSSKKYSLKGGMPLIDIANSGLSNSSNTDDLPSIKGLIYNKKITSVTINFNGVTFKCLLGDNKLIIGDYSNPCVLLEYDKEENECELAKFFLENSKNKCIDDLNIIDIKTFRVTHTKEGKLLEDYNKKFNEVVLTLIDVINANVGVKLCKLTDAALLENIPKCGMLRLYILKHFERGYGFYNEFGYTYSSTELLRNIDEADNDENNRIRDLIIYSNDIMKQINDEANKTFKELLDNLHTAIRKRYLAMVIIEYYYNKEIKINELIKTLMNYCKSPGIPDANNHLYDVDDSDIKKLIDVIHSTLLSLFYKLFEGNFFTKLYKYEPNGTVLDSKLVKKDSDAIRHFEMTPMKKYYLKLAETSDNTYSLTIS
jgi:hypothetical protein